MPGISLVVCVYKERNLVERLLRETAGCYDDLVVVHDGPEDESPEERTQKPEAIDYFALVADGRLPAGYRVPDGRPRPESIRALVHEHSGRYFEGPRSFQQEPHWPFAWSQAKYDWILRLDADEFPSVELKSWLQSFRSEKESPACSGFTCIWPLWNGRKAVTRRWPEGRNFLFHRRRVRFFGMVEQVPIPDASFKEVELVLHHQPKRKSYGIHNSVVRRQGFDWRRVIAQSLMGKPTDLPCWRWTSENWPDQWERVRQHPLRHSLSTLIRYPLQQMRGMLSVGERPILSACLSPGLYHGLLGLRVFVEMRRKGTAAP